MIQRFGTKSGSAFQPPVIFAATFIRKMRGHSQSILVEGTNGGLYVVKLNDKECHSGNLASELIGSGLCSALQFVVPQSCFIHASEQFFDRSPGAWVETPAGRVRPAAGLHYGSTFVGDVEGACRPLPSLHGKSVGELFNRDQFYGMYLFDIWANNLDCRQQVFVADSDRKSLMAVFLDNDRLFGGPQWQFSDLLLQAEFRKEDAVNLEWQSATLLHTWLQQFRSIVPKALVQICRAVPPEWCAGNIGVLERELLRRLGAIEDLVGAFTTEAYISLD